MQDIAVVIPLFNKQPHIEETLNSVLNQSLPATEIIVVDDGSTDGGDLIVRNYLKTNPNIRLFRRSPPGPGGYAARNLGIESAESEWVAFIDADDIWHSNHLESLSLAIDSGGPTIGCGFSGVQIVDGKTRRSYVGTTFDFPIGAPMKADIILKAWIKTGRCPIWTGGSIFRRSILTHAGLFPAGKAVRGGDKDMWLRAIARCDSVFTGVESAEFHQDTVNRVTKSTAHTNTPIVVKSALELIEASAGPADLLLKRLINLELSQYARHAAGAKQSVGIEPLKFYQYDAGLKRLLDVLLFSTIGVALRPLARR